MLYVEGLSASSWLILSEEYETLKVYYWYRSFQILPALTYNLLVDPSIGGRIPLYPTFWGCVVQRQGRGGALLGRSEVGFLQGV
jgi:hypothetical protein